jgi:STE24 endopeptidase
VYFLLSPPALALVVVGLARRRVAREGTDPREASRRYGRWLGLPWLLYLLNVLGAGAYLSSDGVSAGGGDLGDVGVAMILLALGLLPILLVTGVMRLWERSIGHPGGKVGTGVEARAWLAYVGFFVVFLGSTLAALSVVGPLVAIPVAALAVGGYLVVYPDLFRWMWRAYPLPDGEQGRRILALLAEHRAPVRGVLVLPAAQGAAANAFVSGAFNARRYLFLTEPLLERFDPDEVDAVVAHEIGHLRHRHVARTGAAMVVTAVVVAASLVGVVSLVFAGASDRVRTPVFGVLGALTVLSSLLVTRRVARRYEFEADDYAAAALGSGAPMARALRKLARANWLSEEGVDAGAFASHPTMHRRIQRLDDIPAG